MNYSNARLTAVIDNWPLGGSRRGPCTFEVLHTPGKGYRVSKTTTGKPKLTTYTGRAVIADGDDGKTYILQHVRDYGFVKVARATDFKDYETVFHADNIRFPALLALIESVYTV